MKKFNIVAVGINSLTAEFTPEVRRYCKPSHPTIEVDEEKREATYNGKTYPFLGYHAGVHGYSKIVYIEIKGTGIEFYTDTPAHGGVTPEKIRECVERRRNEYHSGY